MVKVREPRVAVQLAALPVRFCVPGQVIPSVSRVTTSLRKVQEIVSAPAVATSVTVEVPTLNESAWSCARVRPVAVVAPLTLNDVVIVPEPPDATGIVTLPGKVPEQAVWFTTVGVEGQPVKASSA